MRMGKLYQMTVCDLSWSLDPGRKTGDIVCVRYELERQAVGLQAKEQVAGPKGIHAVRADLSQYADEP